MGLRCPHESLAKSAGFKAGSIPTESSSLKRTRTTSGGLHSRRQLRRSFAIYQHSARRSSLLREVIDVIRAVSVNVNQREAVIAEDTSIAVATI